MVGLHRIDGAVVGFWSLVIVRFGAGEAGAFPNIARTISRWFPSSEQGRGLSVAFVGLALGSAVSTPLVFTVVEWQGWRLTFVEFGALGAVWCAAWYRWFRDRPEEAPGGGAADVTN